MIDINELRRLAQAATPGPWFSDARGNIWRRPPSDLYENGGSVARDKPIAFVAVWWRGEGVTGYPFETNARLIAAANPAAITELLDRLEVAEKDNALKERVIDALGAELNAVTNERDALRAKIEAMERQEPVAWLHETRRDSDVVTDAVKHVWGKAAVGSMAAYSIPLYLAPGAQPTPSIPEGWKKELFCIQHAMAMNNWDWKSDASNDMKRAAYAAVVRLRAAASEAKP